MTIRLLIYVSVISMLSFAVCSGQTLDTEKQKKWLPKYQKQKNAPQPEKMLLNTDAEPELKDGFVSLINGTDLKGWKPLGGECKFEIKDGMVVGTCVPGSESTYLSTERTDYKDFVLTCEVKWEVDGNSGIMFRAKQRTNEKKRVVVFGPQLELEGHEMQRGWSGAIYGQSCGGYYYPLWLQEHRKIREALNKDWNRVTIKAEGPVVKTWINGIPAAHWVDQKKEFESGFFGIQVHKGAKGKVLFKDLKIKEL